MSKSSAWHSIIVRVLVVVLGAGLVALTLASVATVFVVARDKEASLTNEAVATATSLMDALDRRVERAESDLAAVALAAEAGRPFQAQDLIGPDLRAVRVEQDGEEVFDGAEDPSLRTRLAREQANDEADPYLSDHEILVRRDVGTLHATAILDARPVIDTAPRGWHVRLLPRDPGPFGGVVARRTRVNEEDVVRVTATGRVGPSLELVASLEPARRTAFGVVRQSLLWSWLAIIPLVLFGVIFARHVTAPVRALAHAVDRAGGESPIELPPLPKDEIGELGVAIGAMSSRVRSDASALHRAVRFARHAGVARDRGEILTALGDVLAETAPGATWVVLGVDQLATGTVDPNLIKVPLAVIRARLDEGPSSDSDSPPAAPKQTQRARRVATIEVPRTNAVGPDTLLIPLRTEEDRFGVVIGHGADAAATRMAQLVCRVAIASMRNQLLSEQAVSAEKMAALGRLAASVAHEVNNPLSSVLANLHVLEGALEGEPLDIARDARHGAERVSAIVRDLSLLARGGRTVSLTPGNLVEIAESAIDGVRSRAPGAHIELEAPESLWIPCNVARLEQALTNIISNAVDACAGQARPCVHVTVETRDRRARVCVRDEGSGVPTSLRSRLFEPFITGKGDEGTGLGLYLARTFARTHGGDVTLIQSGPEGTTFELSVPIDRASVSIVPEEPVSTPSPRPRPWVLVIDDDTAVLRATKRWLGQHADVTTTSDVNDALALVAKSEPHLVLCDRNMPTMSGEALAQSLCHACPPLLGRVVFFSGDVDTSNASSQVFAKPLRERDIERIVASAVANMPRHMSAEEREAG